LLALDPGRLGMGDGAKVDRYLYAYLLSKDKVTHLVTIIITASVTVSVEILIVTETISGPAVTTFNFLQYRFGITIGSRFAGHGKRFKRYWHTHRGPLISFAGTGGIILLRRFLVIEFG